MTTLQERIKDALDSAKIKPAELARLAGVKPATVSLWVNGPTKKLEGENLIRAAAALNVDAHWLATGKGKRDALRHSGVAESPLRYGADTEGIMDKLNRLNAGDRLRISLIIDAFLSLTEKKE